MAGQAIDSRWNRQVRLIKLRGSIGLDKLSGLKRVNGLVRLSNSIGLGELGMPVDQINPNIMFSRGSSRPIDLDELSKQVDMSNLSC